MRVGLIHIDGTLPNLVLMKLSAYHKQKGDKVELFRPDMKTGNERLYHDCHKIYISSIFEENKEKTLKFAFQFKNADVGGYFINPNKNLSYKIEHIMPDYSLYKCNYSLGYISRGCIRNCPWCIVRKKEGYIKPNADIYEFWNPEHKHIVLLDNNILALPDHFKKIADQIIKENLSVDFNQGLDARLLNDENTEILAQLRIKPEPRFAFDTMDAEKGVLRAFKLLQKHGIKRALWYVLVGFDTTWEQDMYRLELLKKLRQRAYVMRYKTVRGIRKYSDLASWANQHNFFMAMTFEKFEECRWDRSKVNCKKKYKNSLSKWI